MAGAVSAGAYTAGVIDYLLETLEHWQKAKELNLPGIPQHNVLIEVLSGASAGGMTAAITAASVQNNFPHVNQKNFSEEVSKGNPLYNSWVNLTEEPNQDMMSQMLNNNDILNNPENPEKEVKSIFNSQFIDKIASNTLNNVKKDATCKRSYFASDFELLTTITNLRGYNYQLKFITYLGESSFKMTMHRDLFHFKLSASGHYNNDGKIPFHFNDEDGLNKELLASAAMATGAFPVGLQPRIIERDPKYINDNFLLREDSHKDPIVNPLANYKSVNVDGGVINNEPFELTERILENRRREEIKNTEGEEATKKYVFEKTAEKFDTTLLMIDPFPNEDDKSESNYFPLSAIKYAAMHLLGAMRQQLMVKTSELKEAFNEKNYTRFMIAPHRSSGGKKEQYSIACGSLGGFGGFFNKNFRVHDYMLGRRNCQRFLQKYFSVPVDAKNPIIEYGYKNIEKNFEITSEEGKTFFPIIPDIRINEDNLGFSKPEKEAEFPYPKIKLSYLLNLEKLFIKRFDIVLDHIVNGKNPLSEQKATSAVVARIRKKSWLSKNISGFVSKGAMNIYLGIGKYFGKDQAAQIFVDTIISEMEKRELLEEDC